MGRSLKWCTLLLVCCFWALTPQAAPAAEEASQQAAPPAPPQQEPPKMAIAQPVFDFGEVMEGGEVEHDYIFTNTGKGPLQVTEVRPSCGCTLAHFDRTVPPGGTGKITLKMNLKGFQGAVKKTANVSSNDPANPRMVLTIQGTVKTIIDVRPSGTVAFRGLSDQIAPSTVEMTGNTQPFHITKMESNLDEKVRYELETVQDGKQYRLKVANLLKRGTYNGYIRCDTDLPAKPDIMIRVSGYIEGEISLKPQTLLVGRLAAQQPVRTGTVQVSSTRGKSFNITKLTYDEKMLQVKQAPVPNGTGYTLEIVPVMDNIPGGSRQQTNISIETDLTPEDRQDIQIHVINSTEPVASPPPAAPPASKGSKAPDA
ncbi:MAG: DUF1573 domain-containing protein [Syntrophobacteraceae bacterium]